MTVTKQRPSWRRPFVAVISLAALVGLAGSAAGAGVSSASPQAAVSAALSAPPLGEPEQLAQRISVPWGLAFLPDGDAVISERNTAQVLRLTPGGTGPVPVYQVPGVVPAGEGGLLGLAVSPDFAQDNLVYAYFTAAQDNRIVRFRLDGAGEPEVVLAGLAKSSIHNGGRIAFGPDGMLYAGVGDAGNTQLAQDRTSLNGKILRLAPDGSPAPGNPTEGSAVYSLGHRNVQGLDWDSAGRLFASEFGQNALDEVNLIEAGHNYGWPQVEGVGDTDGGRFTNPLVTWATSEASPSGLAVTGDAIYVAALRGQRLWTLPLQDGQVGTPTAQLQGQYGRLRTVQVAPDGSLWVTTSNTDGRGAPGAEDDRVLRFQLG